MQSGVPGQGGLDAFADELARRAAHNVLDLSAPKYGARFDAVDGDRLTGQDGAPILQQAMQDASKAGGGAVYCPRAGTGILRLDTNILWPDNVALLLGKGTRLAPNFWMARCRVGRSERFQKGEWVTLGGVRYGLHEAVATRFSHFLILKVPAGQKAPAPGRARGESSGASETVSAVDTVPSRHFAAFLNSKWIAEDRFVVDPDDGGLGYFDWEAEPLNTGLALLGEGEIAWSSEMRAMAPRLNGSPHKHLPATVTWFGVEDSFIAPTAKVQTSYGNYAFSLGGRRVMGMPSVTAAPEGERRTQDGFHIFFGHHCYGWGGVLDCGDDAVVVGSGYGNPIFDMAYTNYRVRRTTSGNIAKVFSSREGIGTRHHGPTRGYIDNIYLQGTGLGGDEENSLGAIDADGVYILAVSDVRGRLEKGDLLTDAFGATAYVTSYDRRKGELLCRQLIRGSARTRIPRAGAFTTKGGARGTIDSAKIHEATYLAIQNCVIDVAGEHASAFKTTADTGRSAGGQHNTLIVRSGSVNQRSFSWGAGRWNTFRIEGAKPRQKRSVAIQAYDTEYPSTISGDVVCTDESGLRVDRALVHARDLTIRDVPAGKAAVELLGEATFQDLGGCRFLKAVGALGTSAGAALSPGAKAFELHETSDVTQMDRVFRGLRAEMGVERYRVPPTIPGGLKTAILGPDGRADFEGAPYVNLKTAAGAAQTCVALGWAPDETRLWVRNGESDPVAVPIAFEASTMPGGLALDRTLVLDTPGAILKLVCRSGRWQDATQE